LRGKNPRFKTKYPRGSMIKAREIVIDDRVEDREAMTSNGG